jgi:hypothetical protein
MDPVRAASSRLRLGGATLTRTRLANDTHAGIAVVGEARRVKVCSAERRRFWEGALNLLVLVVAGHSASLGLSLLLFPRWALQLVGWPYDGQVFWPSQAGLFLVILGIVYASAIRLRPAIWLLIGSKASAVVFLLVGVVRLGAPQIAALLGVADGLMGLAVALAFWRLRRVEVPE